MEEIKLNSHGVNAKIQGHILSDEKMKEIGIKLLRWPGGNFAGEYNWKDGFLPRELREAYFLNI